MKVLVSDNLEDVGLDVLRKEPGIQVDVRAGLKPDELKAIIGDYDALIIRSATKVTADLLQSATKLKVVGRAGIGLDNVVVGTSMLFRSIFVRLTTFSFAANYRRSSMTLVTLRMMSAS